MLSSVDYMSSTMAECVPTLVPVQVQVPLSRFYREMKGEKQVVNSNMVPQKPKTYTNFEDLPLYKAAILRNWINRRKIYTLIQNGPHVGQVRHNPSGRTITVRDFVGSFKVVDMERNSIWGEITATRVTQVIKEFRFNSQGRQYSLLARECHPREAGIGAGCWMSSIALLSWMTKHRNTFAGKRVLEMGCGIGLCSLGLATMTRNIHRYFRPLCITASDNDNVLAQVFDNNIQLNELDHNHTSYRWLDWVDDDCDCNSLYDRHEVFDIIIATDCIYTSSAELFKRAAFKHLTPNGRIIIINPPEETRPGINTLLNSLSESGTVHKRYIDLFWNETDSMELLFVEFVRNGK